MSDWISVEDKFPPHRAVVIVEGGIAYYDASSGDWITETGIWAGRVIQWEVTHWMHLPSPPSKINPVKRIGVFDSEEDYQKAADHVERYRRLRYKQICEKGNV